jgi:hypothetical protein
MLVWYCELLSAKCLPLYLTKVPSPYGAEMLQQLKETGVESMSARSEYVAIGPDGKKLTSSTGIGTWKHKDSKAKTHYSFNELTVPLTLRLTSLPFKS